MHGDDIAILLTFVLNPKPANCEARIETIALQRFVLLKGE
jgi:hypothetical protein